MVIDIPMNLGDTRCICSIYRLLRQKENEPSQNSKMQHCFTNFYSIFDSTVVLTDLSDTISIIPELSMNKQMVEFTASY